MSKINFSNRDALGVIADIESDPVLKEQPSIFKRAWAGVFDVINNTLNAILNAIILRTAYSRNILQDVLDLIDYRLSWKQTSSTIATITCSPSATVGGSYTVLTSNLKFEAPGTTSRPTLQFEARGPVTFSIGTTTTSVTLYQQKTQNQKSIGLATGASWQTFDLPDIDVLKETIVLEIGGNPYDLVDSFVLSGPTDYHFRIYYRSDGSSYIKTGGVNDISGQQFGVIPSIGQEALITYATGGGSNTNLAAGTITRYIGGDLNVTGITNPQPCTGGSSEESIANAREVAPISLRDASGFINASSGEAIMRKISGVQSGRIVRTGTLQVDAYIIPVGGGLPSAQLKTTVEEELIRLSPLEEISVTAKDPTYLTTAINVQVAVLPGYFFSNLYKFFKLACIYRGSEVSEYIYRIYVSDGIQAAIDQINSSFSAILSETYTIDEQASIRSILDGVPYQKIGENLEPEDIVTAIFTIPGVDYSKVIIPNTTLACPPGWVTSVSSVTVTEI